MSDNKNIIEGIYKRFKLKGIPHFANDNIAKHLTSVEKKAIQSEVEAKMQDVIRSLVIDPNDHNTKDTAKRVAKMFVNEVMVGRYTLQPKVTSFPNIKNLNGLYVVGPIRVESMCSHHFVPFRGYAYIGTVAEKRLIGLSKFNRLVYHVARRPQIQEEMTEQIADLVEQAAKPAGTIVFIKAQHLCGCWRGVEDNSWMITSVVRGTIKEKPSVRDEFFNLINQRT